MKRAIGLIVIIFVSGACVAGLWLVVHPPVAVFQAPGATEIQVANVSIGEQHISYRCPGPPYAWYWATIHTMEEQLWTLQTPLRPDLAGPSYNPIMSLLFERMSFGLLEFVLTAFLARYMT
jgi:hypothetical protein